MPYYVNIRTKWTIVCRVVPDNYYTEEIIKLQSHHELDGTHILLRQLLWVDTKQEDAILRWWKQHCETNR